MNRSIPSFLRLPLLLIAVSFFVPLAWALSGREVITDKSLLAWICNFWYIAMSLLATEAVIKTLFVRAQEFGFADLKLLHQQFILRQVMLGLFLSVCDWHVTIVSVHAAVGYLTIRLGITLFLLGILVVVIAHDRMKAM